MSHASDKKAHREFQLRVVPDSPGIFSYSFKDVTVEQVRGRKVTKAVLEASSNQIGAIVEEFERRFRKFNAEVSVIEGDLFGTKDAPPKDKAVSDPPKEAAAPTGDVKRIKIKAAKKSRRGLKAVGVDAPPPAAEMVTKGVEA